MKTVSLIGTAAAIGLIFLAACSTNALQPQALQTYSGIREAGVTSTPIIASERDLATYLHVTADSASPLDRLSPQGRARFLRSLTFGKKGLTGFHYGDLREELSASQIYGVLRLFGAQKDTTIIPGVRIVTSADQIIMAGPRPDTDQPGYWCASPGHCAVNANAICLSQC